MTPYEIKTATESLARSPATAGSICPAAADRPTVLGYATADLVAPENEIGVRSVAIHDPWPFALISRGTARIRHRDSRDAGGLDLRSVGRGLVRLGFQDVVAGQSRRRRLARAAPLAAAGDHSAQSQQCRFQ